MLTTTTTAENKYVHFFYFKKSKWKFVKKSLEKLVTNVKLAFSNVFIDKDSCNKD
jgi:hypothetical protein